MSKMPRKFKEIWRLNNEDGTFTDIDSDIRTVYNQSYKGITIDLEGGDTCFCYRVKNRNGERIVYCLPIEHPLAKKIQLVCCNVEWDDGIERKFWCGVGKYQKDKKCEFADGRYFIFKSMDRRASVYDVKQMGLNRALASCVI